mmetsp:Transcript_83168/g.233028  ORF Transcript_83168/g.233028 Transcript_83168/m.233028 type:complete len:254 (-) Transcript_83168:13-774(-)
MALKTFAHNFLSAGDSHREPSSEPLSQDQSRYFARTSGGKRSCVSGAFSKKSRKRSSATRSIPKICTWAQLVSTLLFIIAVTGAQRPLAVAGGTALATGSHAASAAMSSAEASVSISGRTSRGSWWATACACKRQATSAPACSSLISLSFLRSLSTCPRGMPMSFMSDSSMSMRVSMSSKPLWMKASVYCPMPTECRNAPTVSEEPPPPQLGDAAATPWQPWYMRRVVLLCCMPMTVNHCAATSPTSCGAKPR